MAAHRIQCERCGIRRRLYTQGDCGQYYGCDQDPGRRAGRKGRGCVDRDPYTTVAGLSHETSSDPLAPALPDYRQGGTPPSAHNRTAERTAPPPGCRELVDHRQAAGPALATAAFESRTHPSVQYHSQAEQRTTAAVHRSCLTGLDRPGAKAAFRDRRRTFAHSASIGFAHATTDFRLAGARQRADWRSARRRRKTKKPPSHHSPTDTLE